MIRYNIDFYKNIKKTYKIKHVGPNTWRQLFLHISSEVIEEQDKFIYERSSTISPILKNNRIKIYNGKFYTARYISKYMIGFKYGEFT
jgi:ribosomal protein S19